jgi:DNA-directed RNA polymerase subunit RPC12/RpoP
MALVKAQCTECGATIEVNPNATNLTCRYCGSNFIVEKAIKNYNINVNKSNIINNFSGANVTIINNVPEQIEKSKIEYIASAPGNKSMTFNAVNVLGWTDNRELIDVFGGYVNEAPEVEIERDFREYLTYTMDREQVEMRNGEN